MQQVAWQKNSNIKMRNGWFPQDPYYLLLLLLPWIVLIINSAWIYTPKGTIDPWVYHGYFRHFPQYVSEWFPKTYYGSRLSWILPGYLSYKVFPPILANYVLHLTFYYLAIFSFYYVIKHTVDRNTALLGTLLFGTHSYFLQAIGWDYVDGAGGAYFLFTLAMLACAGRRSHRTFLPLFLAGFSSAAMFYTYTMWAFLFPIFPIFYGLLRKKFQGAVSKDEIIFGGMVFIGGACLITLLLCLINWLAGGEFWFYGPSISFSIAHAGRYPNPYKSETWDWIFRAYWLIVPLAVVAGSAFYLLQRFYYRDFKNRIIPIFFSLSFLYIFCIELLWQLRGMPELEYSFKVSRLIPLVYLALTAQFLIIPSAIGRVATGLIFLLGVFLFVLPLYPLMIPSSGKIIQMTSAYGAVPVIAVLIGAGGLIGRALTPNRLSFFLIFLTVFSVSNFLIPLGSGKYSFDSATGEKRKPSFVRILKGVEAIEEVAAERRPWFWYNTREQPKPDEFTAIASVYLWGYSLINTSFPILEEPLEREVLPGQIIVLHSIEKDAVNMAIDALAQHNVFSNYLESRTICEGEACIIIHFLEVSPAPEEVVLQ